MTFLIRHTPEGEILNDHGLCILGNSETQRVYLCDLISGTPLIEAKERNYISALQELKEVEDNKKSLKLLDTAIFKLKSFTPYTTIDMNKIKLHNYFVSY
jgi:hypothetical protein